MVITSHFHYDHIGYLGLFTNARVVSGRAECDYCFGKWRNDELDGVGYGATAQEILEVMGIVSVLGIHAVTSAASILAELAAAADPQ